MRVCVFVCVRVRACADVHLVYTLVMIICTNMSILSCAQDK